MKITIVDNTNKYNNPKLLVDKNGISLSNKRDRGEISPTEYNNEFAKRKGFKDWKDYKNEMAKRRGFKNINDYENCRMYNESNRLPMNENVDCGVWLGIYVSESLLPLIYENVIKMPNGNINFDYKCINDYKIEVKSSCLQTNNSWSFIIDKNETANYFIMFAFDDRKNLNIKHIWLIKSDEILITGRWNNHKRKLNTFSTFYITNNLNVTEKYKKYDILNEVILNKINEACKKFKEEHNMLYKTENVNIKIQ